MHASLTIANEGLLDFDALENLRAVGGRLAVSGGDALQRFGALPALEIVGGEVFFEFFRGVEELAGLNALRYVGGGFNLWRPEGLRRVTGLQSLETIAQYFLVWGATDLVELNSLPRLACIGEYVDIGGSASWETNPVLRKVHAFPALRRTTDLYLEWNPQLEEFEMFRDVEQAGSLLVTNNPRLTSLPLDRLSSADSFQVNDNPLLSECGLREAAMRAQGTVDPARLLQQPALPVSHAAAGAPSSAVAAADQAAVRAFFARHACVVWSAVERTVGVGPALDFAVAIVALDVAARRVAAGHAAARTQVDLAVGGVHARGFRIGSALEVAVR